jgi:hypothetical protein
LLDDRILLLSGLGAELSDEFPGLFKLDINMDGKSPKLLSSSSLIDGASEIGPELELLCFKWPQSGKE